MELLTSTENIIRKLHSSFVKKEVVVFCGAGISFNSDIPLATNVLRLVLQNFDVSEKNIDLILNSNLPFESFFESIAQNTSIETLLSIFENKLPNTNHFLLAKLAKNGYLKVICTTNFDLLIENALQLEGVEYLVHINEIDFDEIDLNDNKIHVIKIHGSIEDKKSIAITLEQVSNKNLSLQREKIIQNIFLTGKHKSVLILGYSCSDVFDISPSIEINSNNEKSIFFIEHRSNPFDKNHKSFIVEKIDIKTKKNPFKKYTKGTRVYIDTDSLIEQLWTSCLTDDIYPLPTKKSDFLLDKVITFWISEFTTKQSVALKFAIVASIFEKISEFKLSLNYMFTALEIAKEDRNIWLQGNYLSIIGALYNSLGLNKDAIIYQKRALQIAKKTKDFNNIQRQYGNLAASYGYLNNYSNAKKNYLKAYKFAREENDFNAMAAWLYSLGIESNIQRKFNDAIDYLNKSLSILEEIGDKRREMYAIAELGDVYNSIEKFDDAIKLLKVGYDIATDLRDKVGQTLCVNSLGIAYYNKNDFDNALKLTKIGISLTQEIDDPMGEANLLETMGYINTALENYEESITFLNNALILARKYGEINGEASILRNLGITYFYMEDFAPSLKFMCQSYNLYRNLFGENHPATKEVSVLIQNLKVLNSSGQS